MFLTGASGFLGTHLKPRLERLGGPVAELSRAAGADLLAPASYERLLAGADTVVHCAAATGKATPREHFRINAEGTRVLVEQCRRLGVRRFVFVSSIAVTFPDIRRYPYARAKQEAEAVVAASGLAYTIVRPTIIGGPGAAVLTGLAKLAALPVVPVFGTGTTRVQPIFVEDLADALAAIVGEEIGAGDTLELGGPEVITIEALLGELHRVRRGTPMRAMHVPLGPLLAVLTPVEIVARRFLPITVGQLATFRYDGVARANPLFDRMRARMMGVARMIERSFAA